MIINNFEELKQFKGKQGVYKFTRKTTLKSYCGKGNDLWDRIVNSYNYEIKSNKKRPIINAIRRYGWKNFEIEILHWWDKPVNKWEVLALETAFIDFEKSLIQQGGYNICLFPFDRTGAHHTKKL